MIRKNTKTVKDVDYYIGRRIRGKRVELGYSRQKLAGIIGLSFQQVQKYEKGINRISASTLHRIAEVLECDFNFFVTGYKKEEKEDNVEKND